MRKIAAIVALLFFPLLAAQQLYIPPFTLPATTCTNQFIRSIATATGVGTCASVAIASDVSGLGTSVATALGVAVGSTGAILVKGTSVCADLSNAGGYCSISAGSLSNSLSGNVSLNNTANYFDGPTVAQGTSGTWFASGTVVLNDSIIAPSIDCKLWDGTTVIASTKTSIVAGSVISVSLSGFLASPAANIRISCRDENNTTGAILFNASGNSKDATITVFRVN